MIDEFKNPVSDPAIGSGKDEPQDAEKGPSTGILFVSICSRNKSFQPGTSGYSSGDAITARLSGPKGELLLKKRNDLYNRLLGEICFQDLPVSERRMNRGLKEGYDLGGHDPGLYLPAIDRYEGRFYTALGPEGKASLRRSDHHLLILSGLYGLVSVDEPIQLYTCPVEIESLRVHTTWTEANTLTIILADYVKRNNIRRVFDLSARKLYRTLIDWDDLRDRTDSEVFHLFHDEAAGDAALQAFGKFCHDFLFSCNEEKLLSIPPDTPIDLEWGSFILRQEPFPPEKGWAKELDAGLPPSDGSTDSQKKAKEYLDARIERFELGIRTLIHDRLINKDLNYWQNLNMQNRDEAVRRMQEYFQKYPMVNPADVKPIDFCNIFDYQKMIEQHWAIFEPIFHNKKQLQTHFTNINEIRKPIAHHNPLPVTAQKFAEGSLIWFEALMDKAKQE
ncbi:hypothetical protein DSECCO2_395300 [anaerobic digester metagenome]